METPAVFHELIGQEHAGRLLGTAISKGEASHAYLFLGREGVGRMAAARAFAAALCCESGGCGECSSCRKARQGIHPDIELITPSGAFVLVDHVREVNRSLILRPSESRARVFIVSDAEAFNDASANAFLKSLEEPPRFVYFILLAASADRVLPTLVSRCQPVRFGPVPAAEIEKLLTSGFAVRPAEAKAYARICEGNMALAVALGRDPELAERRRRYLGIGDNLCRGAWEGGAQQMAAEIAAAREAAEAAPDSATMAADVPEGFINIPRKRLEEESRRRSQAAQRRELDFALRMLQSWFRDLCAMAAGAGEALLNVDFELELEDRAISSRLGSYLEAVEVIEDARGKLGYNIDVELALMAMFLELQEVV